jgi:hypothetical protein
MVPAGVVEVSVKATVPPWQIAVGVPEKSAVGGALTVHAVLETSEAPSSMDALAVLHIWVQLGVPSLTLVWKDTVPDPLGGICAFIYHLILLILDGAGSVDVQVVPLSVENNLIHG